MGTSTLPNYEPRVIEQFAENLYKKASAFVVGSVVIGATLGAAFGAAPLTSLGESWPIPAFLGFATLLAGGIFGAAIGYVIGDTRSFGYRLQAQSALCQLQTERNTAVIAQAVTAARTAPARAGALRAAAAAVASQRAAVPTPVSPQTQPPATPPVSAPANGAAPSAADRIPVAPPAGPAAAASAPERDAMPPVSAPPVTPPVSTARVA